MEERQGALLMRGRRAAADFRERVAFRYASGRSKLEKPIQGLFAGLRPDASHSHSIISCHRN